MDLEMPGRPPDERPTDCTIRRSSSVAHCRHNASKERPRQEFLPCHACDYIKTDKPDPNQKRQKRKQKTDTSGNLVFDIIVRMKTILLFRSSFCRSNRLEYDVVFAAAEERGWRVQTI